MASPLLGYNTNVRHKGKLYHIQTEDSGIKRPHVMTHLFADGGRIIASTKTGYAEHLGAEDYKAKVKKLMQEQHKAMFIALRDGIYDDGEEESESESEVAAPASVDVDALERAAARLAKADTPPASISSAPRSNKPTPSSSPGRYSQTRPPNAISALGEEDSRPPESIFGSDLLSEKSLDEVILSYLAEDLDDSG